MIGLAGNLVNSVDVDWAQWVALIDRQVFRPSILLARAREDNLRAGRILAASLEEPKLSLTVHHQVRIRIAHAMDVADLPGQIEDKPPAPQRLLHRLLVSHVGYVHGNMLLDVCEVEAVGAGVRYQGVHDCYPRPEAHQPPDKITADEPVATGNQNGRTVEGLLYRRHQRFPAAAWRTTSRHHRRTMSIPTSAMRRGVKN